MSLELATAPLLDCAGLDLESAGRISYRLEQTFSYDYDSPVESVRQRLVVVPPPRHGDVHRRQWHLQVDGAPARQRVRETPTGNTVIHVHADRVEQRIEFSLVAILERVRGEGAPYLTVGSADPHPTVGPADPHPTVGSADPRLLSATALTRPDDALRAWASRLRLPSEPAEETAARVCTAVHARMTYRFGTTTFRTTAAEALAGGVGVCQDFAHIMISLCHLLGVPARYVSGHLIGQGGTHAWVEVVVASTGGPVIVPFDPCNDRRAGHHYLTVATGRDYADVAPTAGTYVGEPTGRLTTSRSLGVVDVGA